MAAWQAHVPSMRFFVRRVGSTSVMSALSTSATPPEGPGSDTPTTSGSVPAQDLSKEGLLAQLPRDGENRPVLGGIPLSAKLGQGGMGAVYYGVHPRLHNEVAVKVLPFHLADKNPILIKRFFAEARVAARVKSPHIVNVMDVNEDAGVFYLVMEFIDGLTAAQVLRKILNGESVPPVDVTGPHSGVSQRVAPVGAGAVGEPGVAGGLPEWAALEICMGAADGLASAHGYDVIHRDVKPDNIIVPRLPRRGGRLTLDLRRAKLADLGLAKPEDSNSIGTISQLTMGTPGYMSPEQIRDSKRASKPSDVFSLGSTLYALLAGRSPFSGNSVGDLLVKTITEPHEPLQKFRPDVSNITRELIDHCLSKDPAERFADGAEMLEALQMAAAGVTYPSGALRSMGDSRASSNARASRVAEMLTPVPEAVDAAFSAAAPAPLPVPGPAGGGSHTPI
ncbi:MAG TPA: serine/threonine-protein kinase, partial [Planctomycetota bacterium]|nr:serine/threonine-protein kinase [Planctomycetota bacterium]